jgi:hypothetical protein
LQPSHDDAMIDMSQVAFVGGHSALYHYESYELAEPALVAAT